MTVPIIDLFAGPGGLGEGFSRVDSVNFEIAVSIEKDGMAHETLRLRAAHRALQRNPRLSSATWTRWDSVLASEPWNIAFHRLQECGDPAIRAACLIAEREALNLELGPQSRRSASTEIRDRLLPYMKSGRLPRNVVLIGGPPCQAYSVVGRSRNKGTKGYTPDADHRHFLYREYLRVIAEFQPAVFVMENVKGILTSRVQGGQIFHTIMRDLKRPDAAVARGSAVEYVLFPLAGPTDNLLDDPVPGDFIIKAEEFGVPQARHRVVIVGIRKDVLERAKPVGLLAPSAPPTVWDVISDLPALRPQLSYRGAGLTWLEALDSRLFDLAVNELRRSGNGKGSQIADVMIEARNSMRHRRVDLGSGVDRLQLSAAARERRPKQLAAWYHDRPIGLLANHESRSHMPSDLVRYLFVAAYGEVTKCSPRLIDFPRSLLPDHNNVDPENVSDSIFKDRFRVQVRGRHSTTITSHIGKDGHAFIHPSATQCRSLSVREAARLQTFPDSYVFLGNRTSQYSQVGNAVPPLLAHQIANVVADVLVRARLE